MYDPFDNSFTLRPTLRIGRKKNHTDTILARFKELKSFLFAAIGKKRMRHLKQYPSAIARVCFATGSSSMFEVQQNLDSLLHYVEGLSSFDVYNKPNTTSIMLEARII